MSRQRPDALPGILNVLARTIKLTKLFAIQPRLLNPARPQKSFPTDNLESLAATNIYHHEEHEVHEERREPKSESVCRYVSGEAEKVLDDSG